MRFLKSDISSTLAGMRIELNEHEVKWSVAVGLVLRKTRKQGGFVQEEVAYKASTGRLTIQRLEYGATSPNLVTLLRVCGALEIAPSILFAEAEKLMQHPKKLEAAIEARDAELAPVRARRRNS